MKRKRFELYSVVFVIVAFGLGIPLRIHGYVVGYLLFFLASLVAVLRFPIAARMETGEKFAEQYGTYETFCTRAREVVDYELLFHVRDQQGRRGALRFMKHHLPGIPRSYAERFVDGLSEDDRPQGLPDDPHKFSGHLPPGSSGAGRAPGAGGDA